MYRKFFYYDPNNSTIVVFEFELDDSGYVKKVFHTIASMRKEINRL
jgi:hypothetical protein